MDTVYKEWLIPPQYNGLPLLHFSQPTTLACQVPLTWPVFLCQYCLWLPHSALNYESVSRHLALHFRYGWFRWFGRSDNSIVGCPPIFGRHMILHFSPNKESCLAIAGKLWISHLILACLMISVGQAFALSLSAPSATLTVSIQINGIFVMGRFDKSLGRCRMSPGAVTFKWCNIVMCDRSPHMMLSAEYECYGRSLAPNITDLSFLFLFLSHLISCLDW